jgi:hypothetical protein
MVFLRQYRSLRSDITKTEFFFQKRNTNYQMQFYVEGLGVIPVEETTLPKRSNLVNFDKFLDLFIIRINTKLPIWVQKNALSGTERYIVGFDPTSDGKVIFQDYKPVVDVLESNSDYQRAKRQIKNAENIYKVQLELAELLDV